MIVCAAISVVGSPGTLKPFVQSGVEVAPVKPVEVDIGDHTKSLFGP